MSVCVVKAAVTHAKQLTVSVDEPILAAKITALTVPEWVIQRSRVSSLIAEGAGRCPLTVVTGPAGTGKTIALTLWAAAEPAAVAWLSVDDYDNQPGMFWSYVVAALRHSGVALPDVPPTAASGPANQMFLLRLAAALAKQDPPVKLVLDDLHLLTEPTVVKELDYVLRNARAGLRLMVCSRMDPLLPLHRYRLAGQLAEIRASDLAFTTAETSLLMAQHGVTLTERSLDCLTRRTEGWAAGIRLAAISMSAHPDPDQFVQALITEDSALTGYLVEEILNVQSPEVREVLLSTSILEQFNAEAASELTGDEQAARMLPSLARTNAFVQPVGGGWYRYHLCLAEVLRLKLRHEHPDRAALLHRRAARWYKRNGQCIEAVRHAAEAGDWQLAASVVIDGLAISKLIEPPGGQALTDAFQGMPQNQAWTEPQPYLVSAAIALSAGRCESCAAALGAAERILRARPSDQETTSRLAAAVIRFAVARRAGDIHAAADAAAHAEALVSRDPDSNLARHPETRARLLCNRAAIELWSGQLDEAARLLDAAATGAATPGERGDCLGHLALIEALRGHLHRAAELARTATALPPAGRSTPVQHLDSPACAALAWVCLEHNQLREARRWLKQADAALGARPDKLIGAVTCLAAAYAAVADSQARAVARMVATARSGWSAPEWLDHKLDLIESRAHLASGNIQAALAAAERADAINSPEAAVALARVWLAARDNPRARRALAPALESDRTMSERVRLQACLADAWLSYASSDPARGRRSLATALQLAEPEQVRLPFAMERHWLGQVLRHDPGLASSHRRLFGQPPPPSQAEDASGVQAQAALDLIQPLSEREREVLRHISEMLSTTEVATQMYISTNTVKTHLKSIYRKLQASQRGEAVRRARQLELI